MHTRFMLTAAASAALILTPVGAQAASAGTSDLHTSTAARGHTIVATDVSAFKTPSGNITCEVTSEGARCEIVNKRWTLRKPKSCQYDYGQGFLLQGRSRGQVLCASDTVAGASGLGDTAYPYPTLWFSPKRDLVLRIDGDRHVALRYGYSLKVGKTTCTSSVRGVTCTNTLGHGFFLSRGSYRTW